MIRRLFDRFRHWQEMKAWRAWQREAFCRRLREGDFL